MENDMWRWSKSQRKICKIINEDDISDEIHTAWFPETNSVVKIRNDDVVSLDEPEILRSPSYARYVLSAAKVFQSATQNTFFSLFESAVVPLPHQIGVLSKALSGKRVRCLLADESGMGKTVEAGLIIKELKLKGRAKRILILAPQRLIPQWSVRMRLKFNEEFKSILPEDVKTLRRLFSRENLPVTAKDREKDRRNPFYMFDEMIFPLDFFTPAEASQVYGESVCEDLVSAGWDLVIIDEAHRLVGSEHAARYRLAKNLSESAEHLILISAPSYQGKKDTFARLVSLLDLEDVRIEELVMRTKRKHAVDSQGNPLFGEKGENLVPVEWQKNHRLQADLYRQVSSYVRRRYNRAKREKRFSAARFLELMQRSVLSSTSALKDMLEKRLGFLSDGEGYSDPLNSISEESWRDMGAQERLDILLDGGFRGTKNERAEVEKFLALTEETLAASLDAKLEELFELIKRVFAKEKPATKFLIFTEFRATSKLLHSFLTEKGFSAVTIQKTMGLDEKILAKNEFEGGAQFLIATDGACDGLDLEFCNTVVNYDMPWNAVTLEQRIDKVQRIGQKEKVEVFNFTLSHAREHFIGETLKKELQSALNDLGAAKIQDILDYAEADGIFEQAFLQMLLRPHKNKTAEIARRIKNGAENCIECPQEPPEKCIEKVYEKPVHTLVEQMVTNYLDSHGGRAVKKLGSWDLSWPQGQKESDIVFDRALAQKGTGMRHLSLRDVRVRKMVFELPLFVPGQPVQNATLRDLPQGVSGCWSLWKVGIKAEGFKESRIIPHFISSDGEVSSSVADLIWSSLAKGEGIFGDPVLNSRALSIYKKSKESASKILQGAYLTFLNLHGERLKSEEQRVAQAFDVQRKVLERVGLKGVRTYRIRQLETRIENWRKQISKKREARSEIVPLMVLSVAGKTR